MVKTAMNCDQVRRQTLPDLQTKSNWHDLCSAFPKPKLRWAVEQRGLRMWWYCHNPATAKVLHNLSCSGITCWMQSWMRSLIETCWTSYHSFLACLVAFLRLSEIEAMPADPFLSFSGGMICRVDFCNSLTSLYVVPVYIIIYSYMFNIYAYIYIIYMPHGDCMWQSHVAFCSPRGSVLGALSCTSSLADIRLIKMAGEASLKGPNTGVNMSQTACEFGDCVQMRPDFMENSHLYWRRAALGISKSGPLW